MKTISYIKYIYFQKIYGRVFQRGGQRIKRFVSSNSAVGRYTEDKCCTIFTSGISKSSYDGKNLPIEWAKFPASRCSNICNAFQIVYYLAFRFYVLMFHSYSLFPDDFNNLWSEKYEHYLRDDGSGMFLRPPGRLLTASNNEFFSSQRTPVLHRPVEAKAITQR